MVCVLPPRSAAGKAAALAGALVLLLACGLPTAARAAADSPARATRDPSAGVPAQTAADPRLRAAVASDLRPLAHRQRDAARRPYETLRFLGLRPAQQVAELWPELGWYAEILAAYARDTQGSLRLVNYVPADTRAPEWFERMAVVLQARADNEIQAFRDVLVTGYQTGMDAPLAPLPLEGIAPPASLDLVLSFRDVHAWLALGMLDAMLEAAWRALRPGGYFGVVAHRAPDDWSVQRMIATGYVSERLLVARATAAGFRVDARSQINANPNDTRDYPAGVWTLPPTLRLGDEGRERYLAIGEPDRMTLRLRKP